MSERMCPCGCGKGYREAVTDVMRTQLLSEDQAVAAIDRVAEVKRRLTGTSPARLDELDGFKEAS